MILYKAIFKILKKQLPLILIYIGCSIGFSIFFISNTSSNYTSSVSIINNDQDSLLITGLVEYLDQNCILKTIDNEIEDALFFGEVDFVVIIYPGFSNEFLNNSESLLEVYSANNLYEDTLVNNYLQLAKAYLNNGYDEVETYNFLKADFQNVSKIVLKENSDEVNKLKLFMNFLNYIFIFLSIQVITTILSAFNNDLIQKKTLISPLSQTKLLIVLVSSLAMFTTALTLTFFIFSSVLFDVSSSLYYYTFLNLFVFSLFCLSFSFFIGSFKLKPEGRSAIINVVALGSSFLSGAFVPQELLGNFVLNISKIFPSYYYVTNNNSVTIDGVDSLFYGRLLIVFAFTLFFIIATLYKKTRIKDSN